MKKIESAAFLHLVNGTVICGTMPAEISRVHWHLDDLRTRGDVWFDRRRRLTEIEKCGPGIVVTEQDLPFDPSQTEAVVVRVPNSEEAYWSFVDAYRRQFDIPVVAVTGTCGKTTTKEMIKHILEHRYRVQATIRSRNASSFHLSYLQGIEDDTEVAVFETGVSDPDDILDAAKYFRPTIGVITNIGIDHLNKFEGHRGYIEAKAQMFEGVGDSGTVIINADDENIASIDKSRFGGRIVTFGFQAGADYRAKDHRTTDGGLEFTLVHQNLSHRLFVPGHGKHTVYNALAAIAVVHQLGVGIEEAGGWLRSFAHLEGHLTMLQGPRGSTLIDDTWNSNPTSMQSAIEVLCEAANGRKKIAILGRMAALGEYADSMYEQIGKQVAASGIDILITKGKNARAIGKHAIRNGMSKSNVYTCRKVDEIIEVVRNVVDEESILLVKASMRDSYAGELIGKLTNKSEWN